MRDKIANGFCVIWMIFLKQLQRQLEREIFEYRSSDGSVQRHLSGAARDSNRMPDQFCSDTEHLQPPPVNVFCFRIIILSYIVRLRSTWPDCRFIGTLKRKAQR